MVATWRADDFPLDRLLAAKARTGDTVSLVLPARDEERTVGSVVRALAPLRDAGLVDELVVVDSDSTDATARVAADAGACVVRAERAGKGAAMWQSLRVTSGSLVAFCDADLLDVGPHYGTGLLGPLLTDPDVSLVKGFYDRPLLDDTGAVTGYGGRVTELVARPLLNLRWPALGPLVQPLAGEWSGRRTLLESLPFPTGYGVEIAVLLDTLAAHGVDAIAQVDLGRRTHRQQSQDALGVMAAEVLGTALRRLGVHVPGEELTQFVVDATGRREVRTAVPLTELPPVAAGPITAGPTTAGPGGRKPR